MNFSDLNLLGIFLAALAMFILGALWYSPLLFGKKWQNLLGFTDEYLQQSNMALIFGSSFLCMLLMAFALSVLMPSGDLHESFHFGVFCGFFFCGMSTAINYLYQRHQKGLWLIDAGYQILGMGIMAMVIHLLK